MVRGTGWGRRVGAGQAAGVPPVPGVSLLVCREHRMVTSATTPMAVARAAKEIPPITRDLVELNWRSRDVWRMTLLEWAASSCWLCCGGGGGVAVAPGVLATAEYTSPPVVQHMIMAAVARKIFLCCRQHEMT